MAPGSENLADLDRSGEQHKPDRLRPAPVWISDRKRHAGRQKGGEMLDIVWKSGFRRTNSAGPSENTAITASATQAAN